MDAETGFIWRRELFAPAYRPVFVGARTALGRVEALAMVADRDAHIIHPDLSRSDQVRFLATGEGILGSSLAYIETLAAQFDALHIEIRR